MEPNESVNPTPTNEAGQNQPKQPAQPSGADNQGAASHGSEAGQKPADGKNWMEYAGLQKVVDQLPQGVRDFCTNSWGQMGKSLGQVNKLTTSQKVAGVVALAGIGYLATRSSGKSSKKGQKYRGTMPDYQEPQQSYRSGSGHYSSAGAQPAGSSRANQNNNPWETSFDRQNQARAGGNYQSAPASTDADFGSGTTASSAGSANRSVGYRGSSSPLADTDPSGSDSDF
jgi:hypothetical protein